MAFRAATRLTTPSRFCSLVLAAVTAGCADPPPSQKPPLTSADAKAEFHLPELVVPSRLKAKEEASFSWRPEVPTPNGLKVDLKFAPEGEWPQGATLDSKTGELKWTPTEAQGPGHYRFPIRFWETKNPKKHSLLTYQVDVIEQNSVPTIQLPDKVEVDAGQVLEFPIQVSDKDFPSNQIEVAVIDGRQSGMTFDPISGLLRWEIPRDWKKPLLKLNISATDDGDPPLQTQGTVNVHIRESAVAQQPDVQDNPYRSPHTYVELPELPKPGEQSAPMGVPVPGLKEKLNDNPNALRLSLLVPDGVNDRFTIKYAGDDSRRFTIVTTEPFEAEPQDIELPKQTIAQCQLEGTELNWMWVLTKNLRVRGLQNNIRECVVSIEDDRGQALHLVALQPVQELKGISVLSLFGDDKLKQRLFRKRRTAVISPLLSDRMQLVARAGSSIPGTLRLDDKWLVTSFSKSQVAPGVSNFEFRIFAYRNEVGVKFDSEPSIARAKEVAAAARGILISLNANYKRWQRKLGAARNDYAKASRITVRSNADRRLKDAQLNRAQAAINTATIKLRQLEVEIPRKQALVQTTAADLQKVTDALAPLEAYLLCGELFRVVSDVKVIVLQLNSPRPLK